MRTLFLVAGLLALLPFLFSCSSTVPMTYYPKTGEFEWQDGHKVSVFNNMELTVRVSLDHYLAGEMAFDVEILNKSKSDILVTPENFFVSPVGPAGISDTLVAKMIAVNPDAQVADIQRKINNFDKDQLTSTLTSESVACCIESTCSGIMYAITKQKQPEDKEKNQRDAEARQRQYQEDAEKRMVQLKRDLVFWQTFALRRTTLHPEQQIKGKVFFRFKEEMPAYDVYFTFGTSVFSVTYEKGGLNAIQK